MSIPEPECLLCQLEMESSGVALAADQNKAGFLVVKEVSDFADDQKDDDWRRYAATAAARYALAVLAGSAQESGPGRSMLLAAFVGSVPLFTRVSLHWKFGLVAAAFMIELTLLFLIGKW